MFFLGLAAGGYALGRAAPAMRTPLRAYAALEGGVALSATLYFGLPLASRILYGPIAALVGQGAGLVLAKLAVAVAILFLPAFLMGGTFPVLAQALIRHPERLGSSASLLYAANTMGAAAGAFSAGFYLPRAAGVTASYWIAVGIAAGAGLGAYVLSLAWPHGAPPERPPISPAAPRDPGATSSALGPRTATAVAVLSGVATLGLEVLWTRLLAQVLNNSVYAFAALAVTFLASLGLGALLAHFLSRARAAPRRVLATLCGLAGLTVVATALAFVRLTHGLAYVAGGTGWAAYVRAVFTAAGVLMLVPGILMGSVLPYLFRAVQGVDPSPGRALGRLTAVNSLGAIAGSLTAGFVLLEAVGVWASLFAMAGVYLTLALTLSITHGPGRPRAGAGLLAGAAVAATMLLAGAFLADSTLLPVVRLGPTERLLRAWEGSDGTVAVTRDGEHLVMRLNNHYTLGDTRSALVEQMQGRLPLLLHADPRAVFFLGLGTGITAGAALEHPVHRLTAVELVPEVVAAARAYFAPYANGVFTDPRARVLADDGRRVLARTAERYDVIVGDLFTPWHAGTGSLYTAEHFRAVRARLRPGGIFAQWLPLYQLSDAEFFVIVRTMAAVFPQVTLWRGDFSPSRPIVALIARADDAPLDHAALSRNVAALAGRGASTGAPADGAPGEHMAGLFYAGNLTRAGALLAGVPVNTEDRPVIEFLAPRSASDPASRFTGVRLARFYDQLLATVPPETDPALARLPERERHFVRAGLAFYKYHLFSEANQPAVAREFLDQFRAVVPRTHANLSGPPGPPAVR